MINPHDITYILPIWSPLGTASAVDVQNAFADLVSRVGQGPYVKLGFSGYVFVEMTDWNVDITNTAAVDAALASTFAQIDADVSQARLGGFPIALNIVLPSRARTDASQRASEIEDRRSVQWYSDNKAAPEATTAVLGADLLPGVTRIVLANPTAPARPFIAGNQIYLTTGGGQSEWITLDSVSGTSAPAGSYAFDVTRNVDGSGTHTWAMGQTAYGTSGWWGHSRYSRKARAIEEAYVRAVGRHLAAVMALYPDTLVAASGDGEVELSYERSPIGHADLYTEATTVLADYSPFAIAEFRDWLRKGGLYAAGQAYAAEAYAQADKYSGAGGLAALNTDFAQSFTSWSLRYGDWNLSDSPLADPHAIATVGGILSDGGAGSFDAPRTRLPGNAWWDVWALFRETMIQHHNKDFAKWITTNPDTSPVVPTDRWFSYQIPADYLFGTTPANPNFRLVTSASPLSTSYIAPYGGSGITGFNANLGTNGPYAKTLEGVAPVIAAHVSRWAVLEWNPSVPVSTDVTVYEDEMKIVERYRPVLLVPFTWPNDGVGAFVRGTGFETAMKGLVQRIGSVPSTCSYAISTSASSFGPGSNSGTLTVTAQSTTGADCPWTAASDAGWLTFPSGSSGTNSGTVTFAVAAQSSGTRTATISLAQRAVTVSQAPCTYAIQAAGAPAPFTAAVGSVDVAAPFGCGWTATSNNAFIAITSATSGSGNATVSYSVAANPRRVARSGTMTVAAHTFTVAQARRPAPFDFTGDGAADLAVFSPGTGAWKVHGRPDEPLGQAGDVPVPADYNGDGVSESAMFRPSGGLWIHSGGAQVQWGLPGDIPVPADYNGDGTTDRAVVRTNDGVIATWYVQGQAPFGFGLHSDLPFAADFDGDGKADPAVYRRSTCTWYVLRSSSGYSGVDTYQWGLPGDVPLVGHFDADGLADLAVFRPSNGTWYVRMSSGPVAAPALGAPGDVPMGMDLDADGVDEIVAFRPADATWRAWNLVTGLAGMQTFGAAGDVPALQRPVLPSTFAADFDGDTRSDITVFRPSTGAWFTRPSLTNHTSFTQQQWGEPGDVAVPGDYDGDRKADFAIFRPASGLWYVLQSNAGFTTFRIELWGVPGDMAVPADYDGDGRADLAIYRPSTGDWWIRLSASNYTTYTTAQWGLPGDIPVPADYDGDGRTDFAVYRPSSGTWYVRTAAETFLVRQWGLPEDIPLHGDFDGDGRADMAVYRPSTGQWYVLDRFTGTFTSQQWGLTSDTPVPGDYDGDGVTDVAVYRPSTGEWFIIQSSNGALLYRQWGLPGDQAVR